MASKGYNKVMALGTLTRDPELRQSSTGKAYMFFDLACNFSVRDGNGGYKDSVDYISFTAFEKVAEVIAKYCVKGSQLFVEGKLKKNKRQGKDGSDIYEMQVIAQNILLAGGKRKDGNGGGTAYQDDYDPYQGVEEYTPSGNADVPF